MIPCPRNCSRRLSRSTRRSKKQKRKKEEEHKKIGCELIRVGGACGPPPPVAAPFASSLRAPSRGDPPLKDMLTGTPTFTCDAQGLTCPTLVKCGMARVPSVSTRLARG